uniref:Uncharacterized protein n=1 Tax=Setaria viridis TaxID=4556 RepID=A0A4U6ULR0_SETVI|nr:hypothetical protein SEVIR_5G350650v2 [Setaria viridis]
METGAEVSGTQMLALLLISSRLLNCVVLGRRGPPEAPELFTWFFL